jgi:predicted protein tyrosine phosphatase
MHFPKIVVCAVDEADNFVNDSITHIVSIRNPGSPLVLPSWFNGSVLELQFGDVDSVEDARACKTLPPTRDDISKAIDFTSAAFNDASAKTLVFCDYGASRSPALAYVAAAAYLGPGREVECLQGVLSLRPIAVPNLYVVRLGDSFLMRHGALVNPCQIYFKKLFQDTDGEWSP